MSVQIEIVRETGSTNADLLQRIKAGELLAEGHWLIADRQRAGRGRQGRAWLDAAGNFMGSTVVQVGTQDPAAPSLSLVAGLAVYEAIVARLSQPGGLQLKWPNDLLLHGAKIAGILLERAGSTVVIGVGVNLAAAPALPGRETTSVATLGPAPQRDSFARELAVSMSCELARWREYGTEPMLTRWLAAAHAMGRSLTVHGSDSSPLSGSFAGLEPSGALRLRVADGSVQIIHAGDVALA